MNGGQDGAESDMEDYDEGGISLAALGEMDIG